MTNESLERTQATLAFEQNCARLRQLAKPGSLVYLITDAFNLTDEAVRHLANISRHCELVVCLISDPLEQQLPDSKQKISVAITNGETNDGNDDNRQQLILGDKALAEKYHQQAMNLNDIMEQKLTKAGARLLHFCASEALETQLHRGVASWIR